MLRLPPILVLLVLACAPTSRVSTDAGSSGDDAGAPDAGSPADAGIADAGSPADAGTPVCTYGQDQTCNDSLLVSSIWGHCRADGTCECQAGFEVRPETGKCWPTGSYACGNTFCGGNTFCVERVHSRDGGTYSSWMCMPYFGCSTTDCSCALTSFISASCVDPTCTHDAPTVALRCDDLN